MAGTRKTEYKALIGGEDKNGPFGPGDPVVFTSQAEADLWCSEGWAEAVGKPEEPTDEIEEGD